MNNISICRLTRQVSRIMDNSGTPKTTVSLKMSSGLKEKLRKLGRYRGSPRMLNQHSLKASCFSPTVNSSNSPDSTPVRSPISIYGSSPVTFPCSSPVSAINSYIVGLNEEDAKLSSSPQIPINCKTESRATSSCHEQKTHTLSVKENIDLWKRKEKMYEETLRKLKLVKLYQSKNNLSNLQQLITTWRTACQKAILVLMDKYQEPKPTVQQLLGFLNIDSCLVGYIPDDDCFI